MKQSRLTYLEWVAVAALAALGGCEATDDDGPAPAPGAAPAASLPSGPWRLVAIQRGAAAPEVGRTSVYDCDGDVSFTVRGGPGEVALWAPKSLGGTYSVLGLTQTASGARYEEGDTVFWSKGDLAMFEIGGQRFVDCRSNPRKVPWADAARRGVTVRALGNEPSWYLEIAPDRLAMVTELGAKRAELPYAAPTVAGRTETYRVSTEAHQLVAVVDRTPCVDSMSGEAFDATVTVTFDGAMFYGCGRFL